MYKNKLLMYRKSIQGCQARKLLYPVINLKKLIDIHANHNSSPYTNYKTTDIFLNNCVVHLLTR